MNLQKAVEIQDQYLKQGYIMSTQDLHDSMALGIEALKRLKAIRTWTIGDAKILLPGETEE